MRPLSISIDGFGSWSTPQTIDLAEVKALAIVGKNGAGKSSMLDAMLYALWGWTRTATIAEQISLGRETISVTLTWEQDKNTWRVTRAKASDGPHLALEKYTTNQNIWITIENGTKSTQPKINDLIGCSVEDMIASCWIRQNDSDKFTSARPTERRQILERILNLPYAQMAKEAAAELKTIKAQMQVLQQVREQAINSVSQLPLLESQLKTCTTNLQQHTNSITKLQEWLDASRDKTHAQQVAKQLQNAIRTLTSQTQQLAQHKKDAKQVEQDLITATKQLNQCRITLTAHTQQESQIQQKIARATDRIKQYEKVVQDTQARLEQLEQTENNTCWTCHQPITDSIMQSLIQEGRQTIETTNTSISKLRLDLEKLHTQRQVAASNINTYTRQVKQLEASVHEMQARLARTQAAIETLYLVPSQLEEKEQELHALQVSERDPQEYARQEAALETLIKERDALLREDGGTRAAIEQAHQQQQQLDESQEQWDSWQSRLEALELIHRACSSDQIPARIIESKLADLEQEINRWLDTVANGTLQIRLITKKEVGAQSKETLLIIVDTPLGSMNYDNFSGGERMKLDLACRIGISRLLANRSGSPIRFLVIDEGWGALDEEGTEALTEAFMRLTSIFDLVMTITHTPSVARAFPARLEISKDEHGSKAQMVSQ